MSRILIADDDAITQKQAALIIEKMGHTVFNSPNGRHAYESLCAYNRFDLLIADMVMPEMDGQELVKTIRKESRFSNLPIIIMSAVIGIKELAELLKLGADFVIAKPLQSPQLMEYVEKGLKNRNKF